MSNFTIKGDATLKGAELILGKVKSPYSFFFLMAKRCFEMRANI